MEGRPQPDVKRQLDWVKDQRDVNKVFGLTVPDPWIGCRQLIDFLDDVFYDKRSLHAKIKKPVCAKLASKFLSNL
jgi:hypothetical protein